MAARLDHAEIAGTFSLDGETHEVENNLWVIGDDDECVVFDAPHDVERIAEVIGDRDVFAIFLTHAHDDHSRVALDLAAKYEAPILLHAAEQPVWDLTHPGTEWDGEVEDGEEFAIADITLRAIHTPGHSPGSVCFYVAEGLGDTPVLFSGDTLFQGGSGATGRSFSDQDTIERSIREKLFALPEATVVHTGHGPDTTIGAEKQNLAS